MPRGSPDQLSDPEPTSASCASSPLLELPTELLVMILEYLPLRDLTKICLVQIYYHDSDDIMCVWATIGMLPVKWYSEQRTFHVSVDESLARTTVAITKQHTHYTKVS